MLSHSQGVEGVVFDDLILADWFSHGYATKEGCRTERKSRNLEYAMGVRLTGFTT
jgi:hypothetical protein